MCVDAEDAVWVADPKGSRWFRMRADGSCSDMIDTAPLQAIACTLGGDGRHTRFVTVGTIRPFAELADDRHAESTPTTSPSPAPAGHDVR
jgi:hypothetical protein